MGNDFMIFWEIANNMLFGKFLQGIFDRNPLNKFKKKLVFFLRMKAISKC